MEAHHEPADRRDDSLPPTAAARVRPVLWVFGLLGAAILAALAFGAYRQPELLLNIMGLRYCG